MISIHQIAHALALAEHRHFARAADAVHLTQPALSRSIQALERALDARLFDRGRGGVALTVFGRALVERARVVVGAVTDLEHEIELLRGLGSGSLDLVLAPYPMVLSGQEAVARLLAAHPQIQCRMRVARFGVVTDDVAAGACDLGVADTGAAEGKGLQVELVATRQLHFFCRPGHSLLGGRGCGLEELLGFPWASTRAPARISMFLPTAVGRAGRWDPVTGEFVPALEVDVMNNFSVLARESDILVAATLTLVEHELDAGELAVVPFTAPWLRLNYGFISRSGRTHSPAALEFMRLVREIEAAQDERERKLRERFLP